MLTRYRNILREIQQLAHFGSLFSFSSQYQPPSIENLSLDDYQRRCLKGMLVDKSKLIEEIHKYEEGLLITRPRRWGKTLNLQMLQAFYGYTENVSVQHFNKTLFLGGDVSFKNKIYRLQPQLISEQVDFCEEHLGQYPIIHISLKEVNDNNKEEVLAMLHDSLASAYRNHVHLFNRILLDEISEFTQEQKDAIGYSNLHTSEYTVLYTNWLKFANPISPQTTLLKFVDMFLSLTPNAFPNERIIQTSIKQLSLILTTYYKKKSCILLMDEYDLPFNTMLTESMQSGNTEGLSFLQQMLNKMFQYGVKNHREVHNTIVVGILPLSQAQLSTGWNDMQVCTVESGGLDSHFGYTEENVKQQIQNLTNLSIEQKIDLQISISQQYNGYKIGQTQLYNPFSVSSCLMKVRSGDLPICLQNYWSESGGVLFLKKILEKLNKSQLQPYIISKVHTYAQFTQPLTYQSMINDAGTLLPSLWHLGYLTYENANQLRVPNTEVNSALKRVIYPYYLRSIRESYQTIWEILDRNLANSKQYIETIQTLVLPEFNKQYEVDRKDISESAFRGLLSAYAMTTNHLIIRLDEKTKENKRIDIVYLPYDGNGNSLIIHELKVNQVARNKSVANEETLEDAFWQILCNLYPSDRLRENRTIAQQLILRVLMFAKTETELKEEYTFEGLGYHFNIAQANELMQLFENYDEKKRRMMVKGSSEVKVNERKVAREEFLEHCNAKSLYELLERYQQQQL